MYFTKSLCIILSVLLGALDVGRVMGLPYGQTVRPSKRTDTRNIQAAHLAEEKEYLPTYYQQQQPTTNSVYYQPSTASPINYPYPAPYPQTTIVDQYDNRYPDGSYEYRFELSDGIVRHERGYFILLKGKKILVVKGLYSHPLPDKTYYTVYYVADHNGYRVLTQFYSLHRPLLPQSLDAIEDNSLTNYEASHSELAEKILASE